jgi:hypothetical protein
MRNAGMLTTGFGVQGSGFRVRGSRFGVRGSRFGVQGSGFGVRGSRFGFTRSGRVLWPALLLVIAAAAPVAAQDPPPRIPFVVLDFHAIVPKFPSEDGQLAASRGMNLAELPGRGLGLHAGLHLYPLRWRAVTFGVGGEVATSRSRQTPGQGVENVRPTEERFRTIAPQLSFNFGTGNGWSYLSGGLGRSTWGLKVQGDQDAFADTDPLKTINYGGGARWFIKPHLAFSFDVRFYAINPGTADGARPGSPRTTLLVIGAGVSVK